MTFYIKLVRRLLGIRPRRKVRSINTATTIRSDPLSSSSSDVPASTQEIKLSDIKATDKSRNSPVVAGIEDVVDKSSSDTTTPSQEDVIESITDTFLSAISRDITETQNLRKDVKDESSKSFEEKNQEEPEADSDLTSFGKLTTEDPISALLSNVEIIDVRNFIPRGYRFFHKHVEEKGRKIMMKEFGKNINDLLEDKTFRNKRLKKLSPQGQDKEENRKPDDRDENETSKAAEALYKITLRGPKPKQTESRFGWVDLEDERRGDSDSDNELTHDLEVADFFESLLEESRGHQHRSPSNPSLHPKSTPPPTTTPAPPEETTAELFVVECGTFCSLHGNILITEGLHWNTKLLHEVTEDFKQNKKKFERQCSKIFSHVYFGSAFEFCSLQSFAKTPHGVRALFSLQFNGLIFNITSKDIYKAFRDYMEYNHDDNMMGDYRVDIDSTYFLVVDSDLGDGTFVPKFAKYGVELPDWAWLVVIAGIVCILIVAVLGIAIGVQRHKQNIAVKKTLLKSKALKSVRSPDAFDMVQLGKLCVFNPILSYLLIELHI